MKSLILNEIYSAFLLYHLFLSCYIFKYKVIIDGNGADMGKTPPTGNPRPWLSFYLCGDGDGDEDGFGGGDEDEDGKAIPGLALPRPVAIPTSGGKYPSSTFYIH